MVRLNDDKEMVKSIKKRGLNAQVAIVRAGYSAQRKTSVCAKSSVSR